MKDRDQTATPRVSAAIDGADEALYAAIDAAIAQAAATAGDDIRRLSLRMSPEDYFADGALRRLFLRLCKADLQTNRNGDPETAWKILYMGRNIARNWEREREAVSPIRAGKDHPEDVARDASERRELRLAAERFALITVLQALLAQARLSDPELPSRLAAVIDGRTARFDMASDTDLDFAEHAKRFIQHIAGER